MLMWARWVSGNWTLASFFKEQVLAESLPHLFLPASLQKKEPRSYSTKSEAVVVVVALAMDQEVAAAAT